MCVCGVVTCVQGSAIGMHSWCLKISLSSEFNQAYLAAGCCAYKLLLYAFVCVYYIGVYMCRGGCSEEVLILVVN